MKEPKGFQKPLNPGMVKQVGLAAISTGVASNMFYAQCSCGTTYYHRRIKVVNKRVDTHVTEKHNGRAIWL